MGDFRKKQRHGLRCMYVWSGGRREVWVSVIAKRKTATCGKRVKGSDGVLRNG